MDTGRKTQFPFDQSRLRLVDGPHPSAEFMRLLVRVGRVIQGQRVTEQDERGARSASDDDIG